MAEKVIETKGGPLTDDDFEGDALPIGGSDDKYSDETKKRLDEIVRRAQRAQREGPFPRTSDAGFGEFEEEEHPRGSAGRFREKGDPLAQAWQRHPDPEIDDVLSKKAPINSRWRASVKLLIERTPDPETKRLLKAKIGESFWRQGQNVTDPLSRAKLEDKAIQLGFTLPTAPLPAKPEPLSEPPRPKLIVPEPEKPLVARPKTTGMIPRSARGAPRIKDFSDNPAHALTVAKAAHSVPAHHLALIKNIPINSIETWGGKGSKFVTSYGDNTAGMFSWRGNTGVIYIPRVTIKGRRLQNSAQATIHEIGHGVDFELTRKSLPPKSLGPRELSFGFQFASDFRTGVDRMSSSEKKWAAYWTVSNSEMFAEVYSAIYGDERSTYFGGMTRTRVLDTFREAAAAIRRKLDGD